jgi:hypothetical protein
MSSSTAGPEQWALCRLLIPMSTSQRRLKEFDLSIPSPVASRSWIARFATRWSTWAKSIRRAANRSQSSYQRLDAGTRGKRPATTTLVGRVSPGVNTQKVGGCKGGQHKKKYPKRLDLERQGQGHVAGRNQRGGPGGCALLSTGVDPPLISAARMTRTSEA